VAGFHFTHVGECVRLFHANRVSAGVAASGIYHGHALVLLFDQFGDVRRNINIVVGMANNFENINLVTVIRGRDGRRELAQAGRESGNKNHERKKKTQVFPMHDWSSDNTRPRTQPRPPEPPADAAPRSDLLPVEASIRLPQ
jgi:hypothetical protein